MTEPTRNFAARIEALEAIMVDMLALAAEKSPTLRGVIAQRLGEIAEDLRDAENSAEAEAVEMLKDEFMRNT